MLLKRALLWLLALSLIAACGGGPAPTPPPAPDAAAVLIVNAAPEGAELLVNGEVKGRSPLIVTLTPGTYEVTVRAGGFAPVTEEITLGPGQEANYAPELADIAAPEVSLRADPARVAWDGIAAITVSASDNAGVASVELLLDGEPLAAAEEAQLALALAPADTPGMAPDGEFVLTARAVDAAGNVGEATLPLVVVSASDAAASGPTPGGAGGELSVAATPEAAVEPEGGAVITDTVTYAVTEVSIPTYPYAAYLSPATDPTLNDYPLRVFDRAAYEASVPAPAPVTYRAVVLENRYLKVTLLPDLGGRLYGVTFKPTGNEELYQNPVVKPTAWGPSSPPHPEGANWWLGAGGIEWGFPVDEHGYEFGSAWGFDNITTPAGGYMVSIFTRDPMRPHVVVDVTLEPGQAFITLGFRIVNPWAAPFRFKWWHNAALAPGAANTVSEELRFVWPAESVSVHSTADPSLPPPGEAFDWPVYAGRDLSRLGNWTSYLGLFQHPAAGGGFAAVYDPAADEGMVRVYPPDVARGAKFFSSGWQQPLDPALWTDDGSRYVEMQGGLMPTYDEWYELGSDDEVSWAETWYPAAGIGGLTHAEAGAALYIAAEGRQLRLGLFAPAPVQGRLTVTLPGIPPLTQDVAISPEQPLIQPFDYTGPEIVDGDVGVTLTDAAGATLLEYTGKITLR